MEPSTRLAVVASRYQTVNTVYAFGGSTSERVLKADSRRWYVRFTAVSSNVVNGIILPGPWPSGVPAINSSFDVIEYKYKDCPSIVGGEFYGQVGLSGTIVITECLYLGE